MMQEVIQLLQKDASTTCELTLSQSIDESSHDKVDT